MRPTIMPKVSTVALEPLQKKARCSRCGCCKLWYLAAHCVIVWCFALFCVGLCERLVRECNGTKACYWFENRVIICQLLSSCTSARHEAHNTPFMDLLALIGFIVVVYWLVYIVSLFWFDCDLGLAWTEKFGKPISVTLTIDWNADDEEIEVRLYLNWRTVVCVPGALAGKVVWVTGASSGIGEHLAIELARHGVKLVLSARREEELDRVRNKCLEVGKLLEPADVLTLPLDVTSYNDHQAAFDTVIQYFGKVSSGVHSADCWYEGALLDVLVNNAGRSQRCVWEEVELEVDRQMFELNVFGVINLTRIAVRYFLEKGAGHVAATSSIAGVQGVPFSGTYTATKHALHDQNL
uniref:Uncharacterized protein n=1 Tax=Timema tahoe TaxID=61484 RepID=A0A7R9FKE8_9NEOP|nr:unnamed protein product [Timema tahoe]